MRLTSVLANLELRNPDGSLAWAGYWMMGVGGLMVLGGLANIAGLPRRWLPPKVPRWAQVIWGAVGLCAGTAFILWALLSGPGVAYGAPGSTSQPSIGRHSSTARSALLIAIAAGAVACWAVGLMSALLAWPPTSRWRKRLKKREGLPGPWDLTMDMTKQYEVAGRLFRREPDPDPAVEVDRAAARRHYIRFFVAIGGFVGLLAIGAVIASLIPQG
jgi:hypothetical protein